MAKSSFLYIISFIIIVGCASPVAFKGDEFQRSIEPLTTKKVEPVARRTFHDAERAFLVRNFEKAKNGFAKIKNKFPQARIARSLAIYRLGIIYYYEENYEKATEEFNYFLTTYPSSELIFDVKYNLAASYYQFRNYINAYQILKSFSDDEIKRQGKERADTVYDLFEIVCEAIRNHMDFILVASSHLEIGVNKKKENLLYEKIAYLVDQIHDEKSLEILAQKIPNSSIRTLILQKLSSIPKKIEEVPPYSQAFKQDSTGEKNSIGILLPLTGEYSRYGLRALYAIGLAARNFKNFEFLLHIRDSQSNPEIARLRAKELANEEKVVAIIGPLRWDEALSTAIECQELGVPNISLASKEGISKVGAYIFQNGLVPRVQLENLIDYCVDNLEFRRFAILTPDDSFGKDMTDSFWNIMERKKGRIVGYVSYPSNEEDFQLYVKELVGLSNPVWRRMELQKIEEYKDEIKKKTKKEPKVQLPPIIDFEALFIPDTPTKATQIAATLSYYNVSNVTLLGTIGWHTKRIFQKGSRNMEGALLPGIAYSSNKSYIEFFASYYKEFNETPDLISAQAYEAMTVIANAIRNANSNSRNAITEQIAQTDDIVNTPFGYIKFDNSRIALRKLNIYKLSSKEFIEQN